MSYNKGFLLDLNSLLLYFKKEEKLLVAWIQGNITGSFSHLLKTETGMKVGLCSPKSEHLYLK